MKTLSGKAYFYAAGQSDAARKQLPRTWHGIRQVGLCRAMYHAYMDGFRTQNRYLIR